MPRYTIAEPHPTVVQNAYVHSGRGGAGNFFKAPTSSAAAGVATTPMPLPPSAECFYSGRGGAGNSHAASQRPVMSFDEVYKVQSHIEEKPVGHVGRGGAGNVFVSSSGVSSKRKDSDASSRRSDHSSSGSVRSGFLGRLSGVSLRSSH